MMNTTSSLGGHLPYSVSLYVLSGLLLCQRYKNFETKSSASNNAAAQYNVPAGLPQCINS